MWIKICGMTTPEAVTAAVAAHVDAIGFVFAASVRQLTPQGAAQLAQAARGRVLCVAVTRHPDQATVDEILKVFRPDILQTDLADLDRVRLPRGLQLLPVVREGDVVPVTLQRRILFEGPTSGTGIAGDWNTAGRLARCMQLVLAGGLNTGNVAAAIAAVQPFGVDVSSGVEVRPGVKSPAEIVNFASAARAVADAPAPMRTEDPP
jgi:phosphoribosylanthranilate isomerase